MTEAAQPETLAAIEYRNVFGVRLYQPCDMPDDMLLFCIETAHKFLDPINDWQSEGDAAVGSMKEALDTKYGPSWHVIVGKHFGSKVTHEAKTFTYFYLGDKAVLAFRCG